MYINANIKGVFLDGIHGTPYIAALVCHGSVMGMADGNHTALGLLVKSWQVPGHRNAAGFPSMNLRCWEKPSDHTIKTPQEGNIDRDIPRFWGLV